MIENRLKKWDQVLPLYYGLFLNVSDTRQLLEMMRRTLEQCLNIEDMFSEMSAVTGHLNKQGILNHFTRRENTSHCTTRFLKKGTADARREYPMETEMLGSVSTLTISGFILTPRTIGARVVLTSDQLRLLGGDIVTSGDDHETSSDSVISAMVGPVSGRRTHVTLGCAPGVRPVQTGLDQLEVLGLVSRGQHGQCHQVSGALVSGLGEGRWIIGLQSHLTFDCIYTGSF